MYLLNVKDNYIIFDKHTFSIYHIDPKTAKQLKELNKEDQEEIYNQIKGENFNNTRESKTSYSYNNLRCSRLIVNACQDCNLACKYCYAQQGTYGENIKTYMILETYIKSFDFILSEFPKGVQNIQFFGGEPLLNFKFIKEACEWTIGFCNKKNIEIPNFSIVTNGTILSKEIIDLFNTYHFFVTISIDGNKEVNDINRVYKGSNANTSVFDTIEKNVTLINQQRRFNLGVEVTIDKANIEQFKTNKKLLDIEKIISLNPDSIHIVPAQWTNLASQMTDKQYFIEYFDTISDMFLEKTIKNEVQLTETLNVLNKIKTKTLKKNFCGAGITDFSINVEGDIYPCFTLIGIEKFKIGNVFTYKQQNNYKNIHNLFKNTSYDNANKCLDCWASGLCHPCIGMNYLATGNLSISSESICICQKTLIKRTLINYFNMIKDISNC